MLGTFIRKAGGIGSVRIIRTIVLEQNILDEVDNNPTSSVRTTHRILKENLLGPYHFQKVQGFDPGEYAARLQYARWFLEKQRHN